MVTASWSPAAILLRLRRCLLREPLDLLRLGAGVEELHDVAGTGRGVDERQALAHGEGDQLPVREGAARDADLRRLRLERHELEQRLLLGEELLQREGLGRRR